MSEFANINEVWGIDFASDSEDEMVMPDRPSRKRVQNPGAGYASFDKPKSEDELARLYYNEYRRHKGPQNSEENTVEHFVAQQTNSVQPQVTTTESGAQLRDSLRLQPIEDVIRSEPNYQVGGIKSPMLDTAAEVEFKQDLNKPKNHRKQISKETAKQHIDEYEESIQKTKEVVSLTTRQELELRIAKLQETIAKLQGDNARLQEESRRQSDPTMDLMLYIFAGIISVVGVDILSRSRSTRML